MHLYMQDGVCRFLGVQSVLRYVSVLKETPHETVLSNLPASPLVLYRDDHNGALEFKGETLAHTMLWGEVRWE